MQKKRLSDRRKAILRFIERKLEEQGYPPTVREIGKAVGLSSSSSVQFHLNALCEAGHLERDESPKGGSLTRALRVRRRGTPERPGKRPVYVPLVGRVAAGQPVVAEEHIEDYLPFPPGLAPEEGSFMLEVKGDSMINAGILDGDHVLVQQQPTAENGDIIVAMVSDEATVKRFYRRGERIELRPENDEMEPIVADDVTILGKVRAVVRQIS